MKALILAAGYAKRLYPITKDYPKPLLSVKGKPIINYIVEKLQDVDDVGEIVVITNSKFIAHFRRWAHSIHSSKRISLIEDLTYSHSDRRGAIGDMYFAVEKKHIRENLLVIGGDNLFDGNLNVFLSFAKGKKVHPTIGLYNLRNKKVAKNYGVVKINKKNRIIDFQEKPPNPKSALVAMCLYYFPKDKLKRIKEYIVKRSGKDDATGFYINWLMQKEAVYGFIFSGRWYDIGHRNFYQEAKDKFS